MANGFFLGGAASGMETAQKLAQTDRQLSQDAALRSRGLDIEERAKGTDERLRARGLDLTERQIRNAESQQAASEVDKSIANTMAIVADTIKSARTVGRDPATIERAIAPLVESAQRLAARGGRDPAAIAAQVRAALTAPTAVEAGAAEGAAAGAKDISKARTIAAATGEDVDLNPMKPEERAKAENTLRDDYIKQSEPFIAVRDAKNRFDVIETTGAGDIGLVFQFMKILDPGSTVREGEFATASSAAGVPAQILGQYNKLIGGGTLSDKARREIKSQAEKFYRAAERQHDQTVNSFIQISKRQKLDKDNVVVDLSPAKKPAKADTFSDRFGAISGGDIPPPPPGFTIVPSSR